MVRLITLLVFMNDNNFLGFLRSLGRRNHLGH